MQPKTKVILLPKDYINLIANDNAKKSFISTRLRKITCKITLFGGFSMANSMAY